MYLEFLTNIILEDPAGDAKQARRDAKEVQVRSSCEGAHFFAVHLPRLAKSMLSSFSSGQLTPVDGFTRATGAQYPAFLQAYWKLIYEIDGRLRTVSDELLLAAQHIWQVCSSFEKLELDLPDVLIGRQFKEFVTRQAQLADPCPDDSIVLIAADYIHDIVGVVNDDLTIRTGGPGSNQDTYRVGAHGKPGCGYIRPIAKPRHGPGAVAEGLRGTFAKYSFGGVRYKALEQEFPWYSRLIANPRVLLNPWVKKELLGLPIQEYGIDRILHVRKKYTAVRIITAEPTSYVWEQQGLRSCLIFAGQHSIHRNSINVEDQTKNRTLAFLGSLSGHVATIDLSDASDRLANWLVIELFKSHPRIMRQLQAARCPVGTLPPDIASQIGVDRVEYKMYAGMGNATTFVVQTYVYFALACAAIQLQKYGLSATADQREEVGTHVSVFGDDIIVSSEYVDSVTQALEQVGLKINRAKTFARGPFRESCGMDALAGYQITPTRIKKLFLIPLMILRRGLLGRIMPLLCGKRATGGLGQ